MPDTVLDTRTQFVRAHRARMLGYLEGLCFCLCFFAPRFFFWDIPQPPSVVVGSDVASLCLIDLFFLRFFFGGGHQFSSFLHPRLRADFSFCPVFVIFFFGLISSGGGAVDTIRFFCLYPRLSLLFFFF